MSVSSTQLTIFCDGGSRGNPGPAACAFVAYRGDEVAFEQGTFLGKKTNNEAEYLAVLSSLKWLKSLEETPGSITWKLDSLLVVEQISGRWKVKNPKMIILKNECCKYLDELFPLRTYEFVHLGRELNVRADELVNLVLDEQAA